MQEWKVPRTWMQECRLGCRGPAVLSEAQVAALLEGSPLPWYRAKEVRAALAVSYYHTQTRMPVVPLLVVDDAAVFNTLTAERALCWVHEWRHYKKLEPRIAYHQACLQTFGTDFWAFYRRLLAYRADPTPAEARAIRQAL